MVHFKPSGVWFRAREGSWRRMPWSLLVLGPFLLAVLGVGTVLSANRTDALLPYFLVDRPGSNEVAWSSIARSNQVALENLFNLRQPPLHSSLPTLDLYLGDGTVEQMIRAKETGSREIGRGPGGDRPYFPAYYIDESEQLQQSKVGLRGWGHFHHSPRKPSLRIRIRREDVALGHRYVELQRPEAVVGLTNYLPEQIGLKRDVMTGISEYVRLFINRKYKGVYLRTSRPEEALTLAQHRLPGPYFKGDALGNYRGKDIWESSDSWRVFEETEQGTRYFDQGLIALRQLANPQDLIGLREFFDFEAFARWQAVMTAVGSLHTDNFHNHLYFLDPLQGRFEPVLWDVNGLGLHYPADTPVDHVPNRLVGAMMRDPRWLHQRNTFLYKLMMSECSPEQFAETVNKVWQDSGPDLLADPFLAAQEDTPFPGVLKVNPIEASRARGYFDQVVDWNVHRNKVLKAYFQDARAAVEQIPEGSRVTVFGNVAVKAVSADGERLLYPGRKAGKSQEISGVESKEVLLPAPLSYVLGKKPEELAFFNAVTGDSVAPSTVPAEQGPLVSFLPSELVEKPLPNRILGPGPVELTETLMVEDLTVRPGTTIKLAPGVSLLCRGRVSMLGTKKAPITLRPLGPEPWGVLALLGANTAGSRLEYVDAEGGSLDTYRGIVFKGMINVYRCPDIILERCRFGPNFQSDDTVNIADSKFTVRDCTWDRSRSDGFDSDMSRGLVDNCRFLNTGNDGLDLMTSSVVVKDCLFESCGDKGISVGENSRALVEDSLMKSCVIGSQVKDASQAYYRRVVFSENRKALDAYRKKWLYNSGGRIFLEKCELQKNGESLTLDRRSTAEAFETAVKIPKQLPLEKVDWEKLLKELQSLEP